MKVNIINIFINGFVGTDMLIICKYVLWTGNSFSLVVIFYTFCFIYREICCKATIKEFQ